MYVDNDRCQWARSSAGKSEWMQTSTDTQQAHNKCVCERRHTIVYSICEAITRRMMYMWSRCAVIVYNRWIYFICHSFCGLRCDAFEMGVAILCLPYIFRYPTVYYGVLLNQPCNGTMSTMYCTEATTQHYGALWTFGWWLWWPNNRGLYNQATSTMFTPSDRGVLWVFSDALNIHTICTTSEHCQGPAVWCQTANTSSVKL